MRKILSALLLLTVSHLAAAADACLPGQALFARSWYISNGLSNQYSHFQLWNAGTKPVTIKRIAAGITGASSVTILNSPTALAHPLTEAGADEAWGIKGDNGLSSAGQIRFEVNPSVLGGQMLSAYLTSAGTVFFDQFDGMEIPPGRGVMIRLGSPTVNLYGAFTWCE